MMELYGTEEQDISGFEYTHTILDSGIYYIYIIYTQSNELQTK